MRKADNHVYSTFFTQTGLHNILLPLYQQTPWYSLPCVGNSYTPNQYIPCYATRRFINVIIKANRWTSEPSSPELSAYLTDIQFNINQPSTNHLKNWLFLRDLFPIRAIRNAHRTMDDSWFNHHKNIRQRIQTAILRPLVTSSSHQIQIQNAENSILLHHHPPPNQHSTLRSDRPKFHVTNIQTGELSALSTVFSFLYIDAIRNI